MVTNTVQNMQSRLEVWRNTAAGSRWYQSFDLQGRTTSKVVAGGKTFTLTAFERQINQEAAAEPHMDLFRNGTFVIVRPSEDTVLDEIQSPESMTDEEIEAGVRAVMYENADLDAWLEGVSSPITLRRVYEQLVIEDAPNTIVSKMKVRMNEVEPGVPERVVVSTATNTVPADRPKS